jgi:hypothetical protein
LAVDSTSNRNVTGRLKGLVKTDLSPLELTEALAERLHVRVQESIEEGRDRIDLSRVQAQELCHALSLLIEQVRWAQDELFPQHAAETLTNHALRDYDRWKDMYLSLRQRYRELAFKFVRVGSTLSPEQTEVMFEELDRRLVTAVFRKREPRGQGA